ncbi:MAG: hypothetical protein L6416_06570 [Candidatus Omnitrophica bacterium]|nr:hypothetical protein [Candidatus Omnitrophota bacterium]
MSENNFKKWNLEELRQYANKLNRKIPEILFNTIRWKLFQVQYHADEAKEIIKKIFSKSHIDMSDTQIQEDWNKATAEFVAFGHAFDTINDILLQIVNCAYFENPINKNSVIFENVIKNIKQKNSNAAIIKAADIFFNDSHISYIRSFINTEKHQHLIDLEFHSEYNAEFGQGKIGFRIKRFNDGNQELSEKWLDEVINEYPDALIKATCAVGNSINEDLANELR